MGSLTPEDIKKRDEEVVRLRVEDGLSWRKIGHILGISHEWARKVFLRQTGTD